MALCAVYQIRNTVNNKTYVGSSINVISRWGAHKRELSSGQHHCKHLQRAWDKYGPEAFEFEVLCEVEQPFLLEMEQFYLDKGLKASMCYNSARIAGSNVGVKHSEESNKKKSDRLKGRVFTAEHRAKIAAANTGRKHTEETKARLSENRKGKAPHNKGVPRSDDVKAKISASLTGRKGRPRTDEEKRKLSERSKGQATFLGKKHSLETKAKISAKNKGHRWSHSEETKEKMKAGHARRRLQRQASISSDELEANTTLPLVAVATAAPPADNIQELFGSSL